MTREPIMVYKYLSSPLPDVVKQTLTELVNRLDDSKDNQELLYATIEFLGIACSIAQNHNGILESDISEGDMLLQYLLSTFRTENLSKFICIDAPIRSILATHKKISQMTKSKGVSSHINQIVERTRSFLEMNAFSKSEIDIILSRVKKTLIYFSSLIAVSLRQNQIFIDDIDSAYVLLRKFMFKLLPAHIRLVKDMFEMQNPNIIEVISQVSLGAEVNYQISKSYLVNIKFIDGSQFSKLGISSTFVGSALKLFSQISAIKDNQMRITTALVKKYEVLFVEYLSSIHSLYYPLKGKVLTIDELKNYLSKIRLDDNAISELVGLQRLLNYTRSLIRRSDAILKMSNITHRIVSLCLVIALIIMNAKGNSFISQDIIHLALSHEVELLNQLDEN